MAGHGTVINGDDGQGNAEIYVVSSGGSEYYQVGFTTAHNDSGSTRSQGEDVNLNWDSNNNRISITGVGTRATGSVNKNGTSFTVTSGGTTGLTGTITINSSYGQNSGFGGQSGVTAANVEGQAAYLE